MQILSIAGNRRSGSFLVVNDTPQLCGCLAGQSYSTDNDIIKRGLTQAGSNPLDSWAQLTEGDHHQIPQASGANSSICQQNFFPHWIDKLHRIGGHRLLHWVRKRQFRSVNRVTANTALGSRIVRMFDRNVRPSFGASFNATTSNLEGRNEIKEQGKSSHSPMPTTAAA